MKKSLFGINRQKITGILSILIFVISGVLLLVRPQLINDLAVWLFAAAFLGIGIYWFARYIRQTPEEAAKSYDLAEALIALSAGAVILLRQDLFTAVLPMLWGAMLVVGGFMILQTAIDFLRLKYVRWWILLIGAVIALLLGALALVTPNFLTGHVPVYVGVSLIAEGVINLFSFILLILHGRGKLPLFTDRPKEKAPKAEAKPAPVPQSAPAAKPAQPVEAPRPAPQAEPAPEAPVKAAAPSEPEKPAAPAPEAPAKPAEPEREAPATIFEELARYAEEDSKKQP